MFTHLALCARPPHLGQRSSARVVRGREEAVVEILGEVRDDDVERQVLLGVCACGTSREGGERRQKKHVLASVPGETS